VPPPAIPIFAPTNVATPPAPVRDSPLRVSMNGKTYIMESLVQYHPPPPPPPPLPLLTPIQPAILPPPCVPAPTIPCYFPPPVVLPPVIPTTIRPLRDETVTPTEEPTTTTTTTEAPTTTERIDGPGE
ncbi:hypothetical protein PFISCL1PPCAC_26435, partial [Pristionchus fissidentatus]